MPLRFMIATSLALATFTPASIAFADVERACHQSDRAASRALCRCIGRVADATLNRSEQRTVARWFANPDEAQETRQSDRSSDEHLWRRYKSFGTSAVRQCG
ncbi:hypothetical protein [Epibacterium ulvae]|uniref:hypothetical protein n=1 Tax=Epibacterium ulvae TaxID=1156985 RepID=UPI0031E6F7A1